MFGLQQSFRQMTIADLKDAASSEEAAMLRTPANVAAWCVELESYIEALDAEVRRRKNNAFFVKNTSGNRAEIQDAFNESLEFERQAVELRRMAKARLVEAKRLKRETFQREAQEKSEARNRERRATHVARLEEERRRYRVLFNEVKVLLEPDEYFKDEFLPLRDRLVAPQGTVVTPQS